MSGDDGRDDELITSSLGRLFRLGSVATRVGVSLAAQQARGFFLSDPIAQARKTEKLVLNAIRVTEALGELKGAAMKVGQMLSVHEGLLPREILLVLRSLQKEAPRVSFQVMQRTLARELPDYDLLFEHLDPEAIAAASIGQVYRGRLRDGREVAVKVQYPDMDRIVRSDLTNLKKLFGALVAMVADLDFDPIWEEVRDRLLEELDYHKEADNLRRMRLLHEPVAEILIPGVIEEASSRRVLTMEYLPGMDADAACSDVQSQEKRNQWARTLLEFTLRGLIEHRFLHADPNLANFGFLDDGRVIVYDHGCMKSLEPELAGGYRGMLRALIDDDRSALQQRLLEMGVYDRRRHTPVSRALLDPIADIACEMVGPGVYRFCEDTPIYDRLFELKTHHFEEIADLNVPADLVFLNRTLSGLFGNL
ncbi:MAG: AarF/ABC1/UbiB kinase family protein, partial [Pseudomonadales bacterium]|nr:AarF/ABC1/UbiB kinase family protein [Pseudomonadales bacterium]